MASLNATQSPSDQTVPKSKPNGSPDAPRDATREVFETVVFVVVLVLLLKLFVAEAFVIPTGSMAPTLWGDKFRCTCRKCGYKFPVNASYEGRRLELLTHYVCENCGYLCTKDDRPENDLSSSSSGDRVLVSKYEYHLREPRRFEIPVFRFPVEPFALQRQSDGGWDMQGMNYIKRLVGLGGETIAVFAGDLYTTRDLDYRHIPRDKQPQDEKDAWQFKFMYSQDPQAHEYFKAGKFQIVRKDPGQIMAVRRIVFDLNHQPEGPVGIRKTRWRPSTTEGNGWEMEATGFKHAGDVPGWVVYQHVDPWSDSGPYYIVDSVGYNSGDKPDGQTVPDHSGNPFPRSSLDRSSEHWVSDLIVECDAEIASSDSEVMLELAKGRNRYRAVFTKGECKLVQVGIDGDGGEVLREMGNHATRLTKGGKYHLRLANVDCRMTVWVDGDPIAFSNEQSDYAPPDPTKKFEPYEKNDLLQPARVGARGDVKVSQVSIWRDLLYNCGYPGVPQRRQYDPAPADIPSCDYVQTYYVQPGHFLMFGDNANSSADSRSWGLVPERLMLGRAIVVYFPFYRMGVIK